MHIHIPDGVLPVWLWLLGYFFTFICLAIVLPHLKNHLKTIPLVAVVSASVLLVMSVPLGLPVHLNLMVLSALIVGPEWALIVALLCNFILASFGHGGLTIVGLNTLVLWLQAAIGFVLCKTFIRFLKNYFVSASLATFLSILFAFLFLLSIVFVSTIPPSEFLHEEIKFSHTQISLKTFTLLSLPITIYGALIESVVTGFIVQFIKKVKADVLKL